MKNNKIAKLYQLFYLIVLIQFLFIPNAFSDGFIVVMPPHPRTMPGWHSFPLEVKYHKVDVTIQEMSATTSIDQEFYNPTGMRLEGFYLFPIPEGSVINKFSMYINGQESEAEILDAKKARAIYEDIVRRSIDPALLEYYQQGLFKVRIFPIEPYSTKRIKISYRQILQDDNGTTEYLYPLNTEKYSSKALEDVSIQVTISSESTIKNIYCPTHEIDIVRKDAHTSIVSYKDHRVMPDKDFSLFFRTDLSKIGISAITQHEYSERKGFFLLDIVPDIDVKENEIEEKDITFVLDVSGSMAGDKLKQAKRALSFCIDNLNKGDRFEVVRFSTEAEALFKSVKPANEENKRKALQFVDALRAIGGTNIEDALNLAVQQKDVSYRPRVILFLTDGKPTINETDEDKLVALIKKRAESSVRIFTFGIGNDINTKLLDKITTTTNASRTYITQNEDIEIKVSNLYTKIQSPVLTDLKITTDFGIRLSEVYPQVLPDLFKGSSITVLGRYEGSGMNEVILEGRLKGKLMTFRHKCKFSENETKNDFIPPLWAARKVGFLLDQIHLNGENRELIDELIELSKKYGIITSYTSYLIVEDEQRQVADRRLRFEEQTMGSLVRKSSTSYEEMKISNSALREQWGAPSVAASKELQSMADTKNINKNISSEVKIEDSQGNVQSVNKQIKNILGKAFYNNNQFWIDPAVQKKKYSQSIKIKYGTDDYFRLLQDKPLTARFFSLGKNVKFVYEEVFYEVSE
jgi:Ca-activated chloride channel homolog